MFFKKASITIRKKIECETYINVYIYFRGRLRTIKRWQFGIIKWLEHNGVYDIDIARIDSGRSSVQSLQEAASYQRRKQGTSGSFV